MARRQRLRRRRLRTTKLGVVYRNPASVPLSAAIGAVVVVAGDELGTHLGTFRSGDPVAYGDARVPILTVAVVVEERNIRLRITKRDRCITAEAALADRQRLDAACGA